MYTVKWQIVNKMLQQSNIMNTFFNRSETRFVNLGPKRVVMKVNKLLNMINLNFYRSSTGGNTKRQHFKTSKS